MAEYTSIPLTFTNKGIDIRTVNDEIQNEAYANLRNLVTTQESALRTRYGSRRTATLPASAFGTAHTLSSLPLTRFAVAGFTAYYAPSPFIDYSQLIPGNVWRANTAYKIGDVVHPSVATGRAYICVGQGVSGATEPVGFVGDGTVTWGSTQFSSQPMIPVEYSIGNSAFPWEIFIDTGGNYKADSNGNMQSFGIVPPTDAPTIDVSAENVKSIEDFESGTPSAYWTISDPDTVLTLTQDTSLSPPQGGADLQADIAALSNTTIGLTKDVTINLNDLNGTAAADADPIRIFLQTTNQANIQRLSLMFSLGDTSFTQIYQADLNVVDTPFQGLWKQFDTPRSGFTRFAAVGSTLDWSDVKSIRIEIQVFNATTVYLDGLSLSGGGSLSGSDLHWRYIYRNSVTGTVSNPSPASDTIPPDQAPVRQSVAVTVKYSNDPQVDKIDIYRLGTSATTFRYASTIDNNPNGFGAAVAFNDNILDAFLGGGIEFDNDVAFPSRGGVIHNETLFTWGSLADAQNVVRFTKRVNIEQQPSAYKLNVGTGAEKIITLIEFAEKLLAWTRTGVYQVVGTDPTSYTPFGTGYNRGIVDNPRALAAGVGRVYHMDYDGVYEFPSGNKISQPIDGVFHGQTINNIPPLAATSTVQMAVFDNKLFITYPSSASGQNDTIMVYDILYDRWWSYSIGIRALWWERDTSQLIGSKYDKSIYQLETGDFDEDQPAGLPFALITKFMHLGAPDREKIWGDLTLDLDTAGQDISIQLQFDNGITADDVITINQNGRGLVQIPVNKGDALLAVNCCLTVNGRIKRPVLLYKATFRVLVEPPRRRAYVTDWSNSGQPLRKKLTTLVLELDTSGSFGINVEVQIDGSETAVARFAGVSVEGRRMLFFGLTVDVVATLWRLKFTQVRDSPFASFKLYDYKMDFLPQPANPDVVQTEWSDKGYPYDKYWKEILLDIDTFGQDRIIELQIDGVTAEIFTINTAARRQLTHSVPADIIGKLARLVMTGGPTALYSSDFVVQQDPPDVTRADSLEQTFGYDRIKQLKRVWVTLKSTDVITMKVYCDEVLRATKIIPARSLRSGWEKIALGLPPEARGKLIRFIFTSAAPFKIYFQESEVELKPWNSDNGYGRYKFAPPQLM